MVSVCLKVGGGGQMKYRLQLRKPLYLPRNCTVEKVAKLLLYFFIKYKSCTFVFYGQILMV
jgi:hypothetical protein